MSRASIVIVLTLLLGGAVALAQAPELTPPGDLVEVNGHSLHLFCQGEGSPTVIFEAGLGDGSVNFRSLQSRVARFTRACAYDRAGYGFSEAGPLPRDMDALVSDLEGLLQAAGEAAPYVLAGHSYGGVIALAFAHRNPGAVVGVVLIDSSHPGQLEALQAVPEVVAAQDMEIAGMADLVDAAEAGALPAEAVLPGAPPVLTERLQRVWAELFVRPQQLRAMTSEYDALEAALAQATGNVDIGDTPLIVLSRGIGLEGQLPAEALAALGLTEEVLGRSEAVWNDLQVDLTTLSTHSKRVVAQRSTHYVHFGQPALVEAALSELVRAARGSR